MSNVHSVENKINIILLEKFRRLIAGDIEQIHVLTLQADLTTSYKIGMNYISKRIEILLKLYPVILLTEDGYLIKRA